MENRAYTKQFGICHYYFIKIIGIFVQKLAIIGGGSIGQPYIRPQQLGTKFTYRRTRRGPALTEDAFPQDFADSSDLFYQIKI